MRKGEIAKLTWAAFDRETWTLTLPARSAKTRKPRRLPLRGPLRTIVERRVAARRLDCPLLFYRIHDGKPAAIYEFRKAWCTACRAAGLTPGVNGRTFHDLRRSAVRNMIRAGVDRKVAMRISGHLTEAMFSRYNIDTDEDTSTAIDKLATYVDAIPATQTIVPIRVAQ
jgi:integrase